jgi:hypothetical protein
VIAALHAAQHENGGYLTPELMIAVAEYLKLPQIQVFEVASFYSMFETKPVGRHSISVCTNISCMLRGGDDILAHVEKRLGIKAGQSTPDGKFLPEGRRGMPRGLLRRADDDGRPCLSREPHAEVCRRGSRVREGLAPWPNDNSTLSASRR